MGTVTQLKRRAYVVVGDGWRRSHVWVEAFHDAPPEVPQRMLGEQVERMLNGDRASSPCTSVRIEIGEFAPCRLCGRPVTSTKPDVDFCEFCFYSGDYHSHRFQPLISEIATRAKTGRVAVEHTGGGCFCLRATRQNGRDFVAATLAQETDSGDGYVMDAVLPETENGPWAVGYYANEDAWTEGLFTEEQLPLNRDGLIEYIAAKLGDG